MFLALDRDLPWHRLVLKYCFWAALGAALGIGIYFAGLPIVGGIGLGIIGLGAISGIGLALSLDGFTSVTTHPTDTKTPANKKRRWLSFTKITLGLASMLPILWFTGYITTLPALLTTVALAVILPLSGFLNKVEQANDMTPSGSQKEGVKDHDQVEELQNKVQVLTTQLETQESNFNQEHDEQKTKLETEIRTLRDQLDSASNELQKVNDEAEHASASYGELEQTNVALSKELIDLKQKLSDATENEELNTATIAEHEMIQELQEAQISQLSETVARLKQEVEELTATLYLERDQPVLTPSPKQATSRSKTPRPATPTTPFFTTLQTKHAQQRAEDLSVENQTLLEQIDQLRGQVDEYKLALTMLREAIETLGTEQQTKLATLIASEQPHVHQP
jgi:hypothetical protein